MKVVFLLSMDFFLGGGTVLAERKFFPLKFPIKLTSTESNDLCFALMFKNLRMLIFGRCRVTPIFFRENMANLGQPGMVETLSEIQLVKT